MTEKRHLLELLQTHVPFVAAFIKGEIEPRPILTRIIEALIVAAIGGAASAYIAITNIQASTISQLRDLKDELAQQHNDTVRQIEDLHMELDDAIRQSSTPKSRS